MINAEKSDMFDVLAYIAFALSPITREKRVDTRGAQIFSHYDHKLKAFLDFVLCQDVKEGSASWIKPSCRTAGAEIQGRHAAAQLGGVAQIRGAFTGFQRHLYDG